MRYWMVLYSHNPKSRIHVWMIHIPIWGIWRGTPGTHCNQLCTTFLTKPAVFEMNLSASLGDFCHAVSSSRDFPLLGNLTGWWFGCHQFFIFPLILGWCHHPDWLSYFSEGWTNHQPDMVTSPRFGMAGDAVTMSHSHIPEKISPSHRSHQPAF